MTDNQRSPISKRLRFEILRRDQHRCRYCGAAAPDVPLTVDHVVPVALGGSNDPTNLVASCSDCNAGKSSISPDTDFVADVTADAIRWEQARVEAIRRRIEDRDAITDVVYEWHIGSWTKWKTSTGDEMPLPSDWETSVGDLVREGLDLGDLRGATSVTMAAQHVKNHNLFRYFMGVCRNILREQHEIQLEILTQQRDHPTDPEDA